MCSRAWGKVCLAYAREKLYNGKMDEKIRINKYLSEAGFCSRREADSLIRNGRVTVEGHVAEPGERITTDTVVFVDGKPVKKVEKKVPVMLIEQGISGDKEESIPITQPDHYAMGMALGEELLKDYNGNIAGKTYAFTAENMGSQATTERVLGFTDALQGSGAEVLWQSSKDLQQQPKVDFVIALDNNSLVQAGEAAASNNLHGALIYGIGKSTEAVYYLDTGVVVCLVVPDEFNMGYQSLTEMSKKVKGSLYQLQEKEISYTILRQDTLFSKENQELLFTMSQ